MSPLSSLAPTYLTTDIHLVSDYGHRPLRSSTDRALTVPRTHNRFGDRSFAVAGPRFWNSLPISLRQISSYGRFRRYLKNHLFGIWEITAQCDAWFSALYKYCYLLTYLLSFSPGCTTTSRCCADTMITPTRMSIIKWLWKKIQNDFFKQHGRNNITIVSAQYHKK